MGESVRVELDDRDIRGGEKTWSWVKKGIPLRVEVGPRDMEKAAVFYARRDKGVKEKVSEAKEQFIQGISSLLESIQSNLFNKAKVFQESNTQVLDTKEAFEAYFASEEAGFASVGFVDPELEACSLKNSSHCALFPMKQSKKKRFASLR